MTPETHYHAILLFLAGKFFNDLPAHEKPKPENFISALQKDLRGFIAPSATDPPWKRWLKVQQGKVRMTIQERTHSAAKKISSDEWSFLTDIALHQYTGSHTLQLPGETIKFISGFKIDRNVKTRDLAHAKLPDTLWVEWPKIVGIDGMSWITRTVGILINRLLLLDAPTEYLRAIAMPRFHNEDDTLELIRALVQSAGNELRCLGYRLTIVQQDTMGYRFITTLFGHEYEEMLIAMLALYKEVSDRDQRKFKKAEQVWINVAVRILLFTAYKQWFVDGETNVCADDSPLTILDAKNGAFFCRHSAQGKQIFLRHAHHTPFHPFCVENG